MTRSVWHYVDSSGPGGIESHLAELLPTLRSDIVRPELILHAGYGEHPLRAALDAARIPHRTLNRGFLDLLWNLWKDKPQVIHTHGYKAGIFARLARMFGGPPVVSTMHSGDFGRGRVGLYNRLDDLTAGLGKVIAVSAELGARHRSSAIISNGVMVPEKHSGTGRAIAFVGRFEEEKGPLEFVQLAKALPEIECLAFGDGSMFAEAMSMAGDAVTFHGSVPSMEPFWQEIGLLVMPSRFEGLPMAALEAMARGVPVAGYSVGGLTELLGDGRGFLAAPGDLSGLRQTVQNWRSLDEEAREVMSSACRSFVVDNHSIDRCARETKAIYDSMSDRKAC